MTAAARPILVAFLLASMVAAISAFCVISRTDADSTARVSATQPTAIAQCQSTTRSAEEEVIANILSQKIGRHTLTDDGLPREFLSRVAHRIICESFEEQFRIVVGDGGQAIASTGDNSAASDTQSARLEDVTLIEHAIPAEVLAYRKSLPEAHPPLRGYRAPVLADRSRLRPFELQTATLSASELAAADIVAKRLARDGVLMTLHGVIVALGPARVIEMGDAIEELLWEIGFPVDLLEAFELPTGERARAIVHAFAQRASEHQSGEITSLIKGAKFDFRQTQTGFQVATESGEHDIGIVRAQLTRGDHWLHERDGGNLHVLRQMINALPATCVVSVQNTHVAPLAKTLQSWQADERAKLRIVQEPLPIAQWAQDNGKAGVIVKEFSETVATLVPRFSSRGDAGSTFVPGETFLADGLQAAGLNVLQSPLHFQGGNLLAVRHPKTRERILLIGEAELYRNVALGLSEAQALDAFRIEFGVDRVHKLPSTSFHLDFDVTIRACGDELVAFLNDEEAAARLVLQCGVDAMEKAGHVDAAFVNKVRAAIASGDRERVASAGWSIVRHGVAQGHLPLSFAKAFSSSAGDSGVGNVQQFWFAIDLIMSYGLNLATIQDVNLRTYYESLRRLREERDGLHHAISELGLKTVTIPSMSHGKRGINAINGIQANGVYLMPAHGGIYAALDEAAEKAFAAAMGSDVKIIRIHAAESQRRGGAVHCSFAAYPRP
jgi:hypothetical protein